MSSTASLRKSSPAAFRTAAITTTLLVCVGMGSAQTHSFPPDLPPPPGALNQIPVPLPKNLGEFVADANAAKVLGKALFWDQQAGSDGLACASCHFQAGADNRVRNQVDPSLRNTDSRYNSVWQKQASSPSWKGGPNWTLRKTDFPFHQLNDPNDRNSGAKYDTDMVVSSQGVFRGDFWYIPLQPKAKQTEVCSAALSPTFSVGGINTRQVEPRNTPTVINAVFNVRNFWDGRANFVFNGRNPFGRRDPTAGVDPVNSVLASDAYGNLVVYPVAMEDASLASQAVGPPGSDLEMSCRGRVFENIGHKLLKLMPLAGQAVDLSDSLLGPYVKKGGSSSAVGTGLNVTYEALIQKAFVPKFWNSTQWSPDGFRQIEKNFSLFWGVSIMLYESTLVSDQTPFDQFMNGNQFALTTEQFNGFNQVFMAKGGCVFCHKGPEFTGAGSTLRTLKDTGESVEHMIMGDGQPALYDSGFYNIGVRSPAEDVGAGGADPFGNPLSWTREARNAVAPNPALANQYKLSGIGPDLLTINTCTFQVAGCSNVWGTARDAIDGSFKVPTLRNVELTGPYFHNGGQASLEQVIDFYNRGGDGAGSDAMNTTGFGTNPTNRAPAIFPLGLTATDKSNLLAFLKALTDERVRWERAPFDHPSLTVPNGHLVDELHVVRNGNTPYANDSTMTLPAVGAAGRSKSMGPLQPFVNGLQ